MLQTYTRGDADRISCMQPASMDYLKQESMTEQNVGWIIPPPQKHNSYCTQGFRIKEAICVIFPFFVQYCFRIVFFVIRRSMQYLAACLPYHTHRYSYENPPSRCSVDERKFWTKAGGLDLPLSWRARCTKHIGSIPPSGTRITIPPILSFTNNVTSLHTTQTGFWASFEYTPCGGGMPIGDGCVYQCQHPLWGGSGTCEDESSDAAGVVCSCDDGFFSTDSFGNPSCVLKSPLMFINIALATTGALTLLFQLFHAEKHRRMLGPTASRRSIIRLRLIWQSR